jgi:opacity protein-like surface antigen
MKFLTLAAVALALGLVGSAVAQAQAPTADPSAPANPALKSPSDMSSAPLAKGQNSFTMGQAKGRIEQAGYTAVSGLLLGSDGIWEGQATKDGQTVHVALDYKGAVVSR